MNPFALAAITLAVIGFLIVLLAVRARASRGIAPGETVALDDVTLISERLGLVGRPDRIVRKGNAYIPEEWKSSRRVSHAHRLQLATYFLLIEERYRTRPPHGVVVLGDGARVTVANTASLRADVLRIAGLIRERRRHLRRPITVSQPPHKCRNCGQRANCQQASG